MPRLDIQMAADVAQLQRDMNKAVGIVSGSVRDISRIGATLKNVFGALGIGFGLYQFTSFIKSQIDMMDNLKDMSKRTGIAVENLAGLKLAADQSGTSLEGLGVAVKNLNAYMVDAFDNNKEKQAVLKALGVDAKEPMKALYQLADAFKLLGDTPLRAATAQKILGKSAQEVIPLLAGGSEELRKQIERGKQIYGITTDMARAADEFNDQLVEMKAVASTAGITIGNVLVPSLNNLAKEFNEAVVASGGFGQALRNSFILAFDPRLFGVINDLQLLKEKLEKGILSSTERAALTAQKQVLEMKQRDEALNLLKKAGDLGREGLPRGLAANDQVAAQNAENQKRRDAIAKLAAIERNELARKYNAELDKELLKLTEGEFTAKRRVAAEAGILDLVEERIARNQEATFNFQQDLAAIEKQEKAWESNTNAMEEYAQSLSDANDMLEYENTLFGKSSFEREKALRIKTLEIQAAEKLRALDRRDPGFAQRKTDIEETAIREQQRLAAAMDENYERSRAFATGFSEGLQQIMEDATNTAQQVRGFFENMFQGMEDAITNFVMHGKLNFKDFANAVIEDLLRISIRQMIVAPLAGGLLGMNPFGGARAAGGPVSPGSAYLVGERGPELFMPDTSGSITPAGMAPQVSININNQGLPKDAKVSAPKFDGRKFVIDVVLKDIDSNGPIRSALMAVR